MELYLRVSLWLGRLVLLLLVADALSICVITYCLVLVGCCLFDDLAWLLINKHTHNAVYWLVLFDVLCLLLLLVSVLV